jgi:hypothetical protein
MTQILILAPSSPAEARTGLCASTRAFGAYAYVGKPAYWEGEILWVAHAL